MDTDNKVPELSVIMPIYNERESVTETLSKVLAIPIDLEIFAVDDCSTDGTIEILEDFVKDHGSRRFRKIRNT